MVYDKCLNEKSRTRILNHCKTNSHGDFHFSKGCNKCLLQYYKHASLLKSKCNKENHTKIQHVSLSGESVDFVLCKACHLICLENSKCREIDECEHVGTRSLTSMNPISIGVVCVRNHEEYNPIYKPREANSTNSERSIVFTKTFEGSDCITKFYSFLKQYSDTLLEMQTPSSPAPAFRYIHFCVHMCKCVTM